MTKTCAAFSFYHFANPGLPVLKSLGITVDGSFVLNFGFGVLGFV